MTPRARLVPVATTLALTAALVAGSTGAQAESGPRLEPTKGAAGIGDPYFPQDGNGGIDVLHYDVRDRYGFGSGRLTGTTRLEVRATQDLSRFNLDFLLPVRSVKVDGRRAMYHRTGDHELRITPRKALATGSTFTVKVEYAGFPATKSSQGESNWLADETEVVAMNEPHMATYWFPANDHPRDKAPFDIRITVPKGKQVIANGVLVGKSRRGGQATTHWRSVEPMAPYLAFFAAGSFEVRNGETAGRPWTVAVSKQIDEPNRSDGMKLMLRSGEITAWLESVLGTYPFSTTGGLMTGLPVGFALENQTRPTYPMVTSSSTSLVVHELAHQWFGDSVSVDTWRDIWLNEGFATFMEAYYDETHGGDPTYTWLQQTYDDRLPFPEFWDLTIGDPGKRHIFDTPVYTRGGMALAALRHRIGDAAFFGLLRTWTEQHRYGNGTIAQFAALAESTSGQDLDGFFTAWLATTTPPAKTAENGLL